MLLALGALLFYGLTDVAYKRAAIAGIAAHQLLLVQNVILVPISVLYATAVRPFVLTGNVWWGAVIAVFAFAGFYNFARSLKVAGASTVAPVFRLNFVITASLAMLLLGEAATIVRLCGLALAMLSVWLLLREGPNSSGIGLGVVARVLAATCAIGVGQFMFKMALSLGTPTSVILVSLVVTLALICTAFAWLTDGRITASRSTIVHGAVAAVTQGIGFICLLEGLARGDASVVAPVAQLGFVVTALVGIVWFKERATFRKLAGLATAATAVFMLGLTS